MKKMVSLMMSAALMLTSVPVQVYAEDADTGIAAEETEESTVFITDTQDITEASTETILLQETQALETEALSDVESEDATVTQPETEEIDLPAETEQESETEGVALPESERMTEEDTEPVSESADIEDEELIIEEGTDISYGIDQIDLENMGVMAAEEDAATGFTYELLEDGTAEITGYTGEQTGDLIIPAMVGGYTVTSIGDRAFYGCDGFTGELKLPESLTRIGDRAFYGCTDFTGALVLPDSLTDIGENAFCHYVRIKDMDRLLFGSSKCLIGLGLQDHLAAMTSGMWQIPASSWKSSDENILTVDADGTLKAVGEGTATISVITCDGVSQEMEISVVDVLKNNELYTMPSTEKFSELWVGDSILIGQKKHTDGSGPVYEDRDPVITYYLDSVEVVSGSDFVTVEKEGGMEDPATGGSITASFWIRCNKAGTVKLRVHYIEGCGIAPVDLTLNIKERPVPITVLPKQIKLGGSVSFLFENLPYGTLPNFFVEDMKCFYKDDAPLVYGGYGEIYTRDSVEPGAFARGYNPICRCWDALRCAIQPGKIEGILYFSLDDCKNEVNAYATYQVEIVEPVIETNEKTIQAGTVYTFQSVLSNTEFVDKDEASLSDYERMLYYLPKLEIISGKDCVELQNDAQATTLTLKQQMKFLKAGEVRLKITYVPTGKAIENNVVYQPEKIVTINVVDELETEAPETEPQQTEAPAAEVKVSSVKITTADLSVQKGKTLQLAAAVKPENAKNKALAWSSSDTSIATVNARGVVTGKKYGTVTITAKAADGSGKSVQCRVKVGYGITYKLNSGKNSAKNPRAYYKSTVKLQNPTRKGYLFKGWYTDKKYKKKITKIASSSKKNLTLYAKWEKVKTGKAAISSLKNAKGKKATLKFKKVSKASGYEILYGTAKNLKGAKTVTSKKTTVTLKGLTKGKTYYVKVRAYRTDSAGSKVYGKYSGVKRVKITK